MTGAWFDVYGIPFEIDTYMKFGISEASTHTNEGGTGIGLLDTWTFKKKYHVSLIIEELGIQSFLGSLLFRVFRSGSSVGSFSRVWF